MKSVAFALIAAVASSPPAPGGGIPAWAPNLAQRLERIDARFPGEIGVYVQQLQSGDALSVRGEEAWYLASGVKVPVAIAVMRGVERGELQLDTKIVLQAGDYVDGAGPTRLHRPGTTLTVDYLMRQMLVRSDNTATDALIRSIGLARVNEVAHELVSMPDGGITTLADVRRRAYSAFHPAALDLDGDDLIALKRVRNDEDRLRLLVELLGISPADLRLHDFDSAFDAYYATRLNSASLRDYARMLRALQAGEALDPASTNYLLGLLAKVSTGAQRIRAGLPASMRFAHKTGTQRARVCDFGIVSRVAPQTPLAVVAACTRGEASLARSERALREVGAALEASGLLDSHSDGALR